MPYFSLGSVKRIFGFVKRGFVKGGFVKGGFVKHQFVKGGFVKSGFVKGGFVKGGFVPPIPPRGGGGTRFNGLSGEMPVQYNNNNNNNTRIYTAPFP